MSVAIYQYVKACTELKTAMNTYNKYGLRVSNELKYKQSKNRGSYNKNRPITVFRKYEPFDNHGSTIIKNRECDCKNHPSIKYQP